MIRGEPALNRLLRNGWFDSWAAVGRLLGLTCKHLRMKSRASLDRDSGIGGGSPLPIRNIACICSDRKIYMSILSSIVQLEKQVQLVHLT